MCDFLLIQEVQIQVNQLENLIASLNVRADDYRQRIIELENRVHTLPEIEAELVALNRGYEITKKKYEELLSRKETAQLAQQADETTDKIQFRVIDPPRKATKPSGPKRFILFGVVLVLGFGVGIGLSLLFGINAEKSILSVFFSPDPGRHPYYIQSSKQREYQKFNRS